MKRKITVVFDQLQNRNTRVLFEKYMRLWNSRQKSFSNIRINWVFSDADIGIWVLQILQSAEMSLLFGKHRSVKRNVNAFNFCREGTMTYRTNRAAERQTQRKIIPSFAKTKTRVRWWLYPEGGFKDHPLRHQIIPIRHRGAFSTILHSLLCATNNIW